MPSHEQLASQDLYTALYDQGVDYFTGVPDSVVSPFSFYLVDNHASRHLITANEGNAIGTAIGYHVATGRVPLVYMQNSGLGNAVDPLVSLADPSVLSVPMLLLVGWRGEPGFDDEPQHTKQGAITPDLLGTLGIPHATLSSDVVQMRRQVHEATRDAIVGQHPAALLLSMGTLQSYGQPATPANQYPLIRESAVRIVAETIRPSAAIVASIGKISRELYEIREAQPYSEQGHARDLLTVGGMGHASSIALGIAEQQPDRPVYCLDGDGSVLMHMGALATIGSRRPGNLHHIVFNNGAHDSVGGQASAGFAVDIPAVAAACGYQSVQSADQAAEVTAALAEQSEQPGPTMLEIRVRQGARSDLGRPGHLPVNNKSAYMRHLQTDV
jgi:phosphonopyruvate decarboxylase